MARQPWRVTRPLVFVLSLVLVLEAMWIAPAQAAAMPARPPAETPEAPLVSWRISDHYPLWASFSVRRDG